MKQLLCTLFICCSVFFIMPGCDKPELQPEDSFTPITLPAQGASVVAANNQFALDVFSETINMDLTDKNKLISPLSIYLALSMVYNGADGATKTAIDEALRLKGLDIQTLNSVCRALIRQLPESDNKVKLDIANSIWYRNDFHKPLSTFLNTVEEYYNASVRESDFNNPQTVTDINNWVSQKTNKKIEKIVENLSPGEVMMLINAIYFNGKWQSAFKASDTYNDEFHLNNGSTVQVPFMKQELTIPVHTNSDFTILELPYGSGKGFSMLAIQPTQSGMSDWDAFLSSIDQNSLNTAIGNMDSSSIELRIPRWEYSYTIDNMQPGLTALGMGIAFTEEANFSKMYDAAKTKVKISRVIHKTYIKVNEEGTEAAAVTAIGMETTSVRVPKVIKLDRPFLYAIMEKQTNTILFLGLLNNPADADKGS